MANVRSSLHGSHKHGQAAWFIDHVLDPNKASMASLWPQGDRATTFI
jgi:hypothetical protein